MNRVYVTWYFQVRNLCDVGFFHTSVGPDLNARQSPEVSPLASDNGRVFRLNVVSGKEVVEIWVATTHAQRWAMKSVSDRMDDYVYPISVPIYSTIK